jgi:uncharacterized NAD-dependent epimerase/dehydratase family protein
MPDPGRVVKIAKLLSQCPLIGIGLNHEHLSTDEALKTKKKLHRRFKVPVEDPGFDGVTRMADAVVELRNR